MKLENFTCDLVVVGGAGHVGLPLAIMMASKGKKTIIYDINPDAVQTINAGILPFLEPDAELLLSTALSDGLLLATTDPRVIGTAENVVVVIGTPVDEHLNPNPNALVNSLREIEGELRNGQLLVLRSTLFPGVTRSVKGFLTETQKDINLVFCPERIAEHNAVEELVSLPQIVSAYDDKSFDRGATLFACLTKQIVRLKPEEAELAKLFTNTWRYIKFAAANQFYMMANNLGLDYEVIREAIRFDYPRAKDLPSAGFAAGPCLFKDTMQLSAFAENSFALGHSAMLVNEGLPLYVISKIEEKYDLPALTVGILGMSFKAESDDIRSSLSYKLKRSLSFKALKVLTTDPFVSSKTDSTNSPLADVLAKSDLLIIATPHAQYRDLNTNLPVVDVWNLLGNGSQI